MNEPRFVVCALALAIGCASPVDADADPATVPALHSGWTFPPPPRNASGNAGYYNIDSHIRVTVDPGSGVAMFWAAGFGFAGAKGGGYIGIQDGVGRSDGTIGKVALFSIWDATGATPSGGSRCTTFAGEGSGFHCSIEYPWVVGHAYRLRVWWISPGDFRGAIADEQTGIDTVIGDITVPTTWQWLDVHVDNFTENISVTNGKTYASCAAVPRAAATIYAPTANAKTVAVIAGSSSINTDASCANVRSFTQHDLKAAIEEMNP